jgi:hypothetical protein
MATVYPTAAGAWSTRTWNNDATGAAYGMAPQTGDTVLANGLAITLDTNITVVALSTRAGTTAVAGGSFTTSGTRTITADSYAGTSNCLILTASSSSVQSGNSFGSDTTNSSYGTTINSTCTQNGNATGGNGSARTGTLINAGGLQNGNSTGGSGGSAYGTYIHAGGVQIGNSTGGSGAGALGTYINGGIQNGNATGGPGTSAHGTGVHATGSIFYGNATGSSTASASSHGIEISVICVCVIPVATGNTSGNYGARYNFAPAGSIVVIDSIVGTWGELGTQQDYTKVPFADRGGGGGPTVSVYVG